MKHFSKLNFYELLEVLPNATRVEIQKAYEMAKKTYSEDSLISYSLFDPEFRVQILQRIEEAFRVLGDEERRRHYDEENGFRDRTPISTRGAGETAHRSAVGTRGDESAMDTEGAPQVPKPPIGEFDIPQEEISGARLKEVRERQGIPLQEVADNTRINITYLQYIEAEKFSMLPAEVFLRGYLDQYARAIFLVPSRVVEGYIRLYRDWKMEKGG